MTPILRRLIDAPLQAWRNGGGSTRELLAWPAADDWRVRISVADVEADGAFSSYPGVERWFTVLQGAGIELVVDGRTHHLARGDAPLRFDGAAAAHARLVDGPTRDLNLMLLRATGTMQAAADGLPWSPAATQCGLFSAVAGRCEADGSEAIEVPAYALLWFEAAPATLSFSAAQRPAALIGWWLASTPQEA